MSKMLRGWGLTLDSVTNTNDLRAAMVEIEAYSKELEGEEPQEAA